MDDNYLDEVLPRWQFLKEYLIAQMKEYVRLLREDREVFKISAEMIEKIEKIETAKDLKKIPEEIENWQEKLAECSRREWLPSNFYLMENGRFRNLVFLTELCNMMNKNEQNKERTK